MATTKNFRGYKELSALIKSKEIDNKTVLLFYGNEPFLKYSYTNKLKDYYINPASSDFDLVVLKEPDSIEKIVDHLEGLPVFSKKRLVLVYDFLGLENVSNADVIQEYLNSPSETNLLVFIVDDIKKTTSTYKRLDKADAVFMLSTLDKPSLLNWIDYTLEDISEKYRAGANYHRDAYIISCIADKSGYQNGVSDLYEVLNIIELACALSENGSLTEEDIENVTTYQPDTVVWDFLDAVSNNDKQAGLFMLENMLLSGENIFSLLALLIGQFELMLAINELIANGETVNTIVKILGHKSDFRIKKLMPFAKKYTALEIMDILLSLYTVDKNIKTGLYPDDLALSICISKM
jgi:DNA polymerase III delta subunit